MPCQAQKHSGGRTTTRPHRTTAAVIEAAIVGAAGRGPATSLCSAMRQTASGAAVDGNAHIRAIDSGIWLSVAYSARQATHHTIRSGAVC